MSDELQLYEMAHRPDPARPLTGKTVLVVEDSRFASEAIRLLCLRSGARIRRADSLAAAHRHLAVYRPSIVIVDLGLPDGSGIDLIRELDSATPRVAAIFGLSGDDGFRELALAAGADGFFSKPIESLAAFQQAVLAALPVSEGPVGPRPLSAEMIEPDPMALRDDFMLVADTIRSAPEGEVIDYIAQFLSGVARSAHDDDLEQAARGLAMSRALGRGTGTDLARVAGLLTDRIGRANAI